MVGEISASGAGQTVPFFVVALFVVSYLIWAKFLNSGKIKIDFELGNSVEKVAEVLSVFAIVSTMIFGFFFTTAGTTAILQSNVTDTTIQNIWTGTTRVVIASMLLFLIAFILIDKSKKKADAIVMFLMFSFVQAITIGLVVGAFAWSILSGRTEFVGQLFVLTLLTSFFLGVSLILRTKIFGEFHWGRASHKSITTIVIVISALLAWGIQYCYQMEIVTYSIPPQQYRIPYSPDSHWNSSMTGKESTIFHVQSLGKMPVWTIPEKYTSIAFDYSGPHYLVNENKLDEINLWVNTSHGTRPIGSANMLTEENGITYVNNLPRERKILIYYDKKQLKKENISDIVVTVPTITPISIENYSLDYSALRDKNIFNIQIAIFSSITGRTSFDTTSLVSRDSNVDIESFSKCAFFRPVLHDSRFNGTISETYCNNDECRFEVSNYRHDDILSVFLSKDGNSVYLAGANTVDDVNATIQVELRC